MDRALRRYYVAVSSPELKLATLMELLTALQHDNVAPGGSEQTCSLPLTATICCCSRDSLDSVTAALLDAPDLFSVLVLHSDMTDKEREAQALHLKRAALGRSGEQLPRPSGSGAGDTTWKGDGDQGAGGTSSRPPANDAASFAPTASRAGSLHQQQQERVALDGGGGGEPGASGSAVLLVTTDVCLKAVPKELLPLGAPLLIQFDLARHKDTYLKRVSTVFGGGKERRSAAGRTIVIDFVAAGEVAAFRASEAWSSGAIKEMPVHVADIFGGF